MTYVKQFKTLPVDNGPTLEQQVNDLHLNRATFKSQSINPFYQQPEPPNQYHNFFTQNQNYYEAPNPEFNYQSVGHPQQVQPQHQQPPQRLPSTDSDRRRFL